MGPRNSVLAAGALATCAFLAADARGQSRTYTLDADFDLGVLVEVHHDAPNADQLQLERVSREFSVIWVPASRKGTVVKIDSDTGVVLGEYRSSPQGLYVSGGDPSRTSVDDFGNVWVGNRAPGARLFVPRASVVKIGLVLGGARVRADGTPDPNGGYLAPPFEHNTCVDRDGDGLIRTSRGLDDILPWPDRGDGQGSACAGDDARVQDAEDECLLVFQRYDAEAVRVVAIDGANHVWIGGTDSEHYVLLDRTTGCPLATTPDYWCGNYAGLVDCQGILWTTTQFGGAAGPIFRYDPAAGVGACLIESAGEAIETKQLSMDSAGVLWYSTPFRHAVSKLAPDGTLLGTFPVDPLIQCRDPWGDGPYPYGLSVRWEDDSVWTPNQGCYYEGDWHVGSVSRLSSDGTFLRMIPLVDGSGTQGHGPRGVTFDYRGRAWVPNLGSENVMRIDPVTNAVDLTVALPGSAPYAIFDGGVKAHTFSVPSGSWAVVQDGGAARTAWRSVRWTATEPPGAALVVRARAAETVAGLGGAPWVGVANGGVLAGLSGRYLEVAVAFTAPPGARCSDKPSPVLHDLTIDWQPDCAAPLAAFTSDAPRCFDSCQGVQFFDRSSGGPTSWQWDFGDGTTSAERNPTHVFPGPGTYTVRLTIDNGCGPASITGTVLIEAAVIADFTSDAPACAGSSIRFTDASRGATPTAWAWDFGDGGTASVPNPTHAYAAPGTYVVRLVATGACGDSLPMAKTVRALTVPAADFTSNSPQCVLGLAFRDASSEDPTSWLWDFGDGATSTAQHPAHAYASPGAYSVSLAASNACGTSPILRQVVTVDPDLGRGHDHWSRCESPRGPTHPRPGTTSATDTARTVWEFDDGAYCRTPPCSFAMYVVADCGRALKIPLEDVESGALLIYSLFAGRYETLTAASTGGWSAGPASLIEWQDCGGLDPRWNDQVTTIEFSGTPSVCGVFRLEFPEQHAGYWWDLFTNCDGSNTPGFTIYAHACDALAAYRPLPELAVRDVTAVGACPDFVVSYEVVNTGCVAVDAPVRLSNSLDGGTVNDTVPQVPPGAARRWSTAVTVTRCVAGNFAVEVDPVDRVAECTESVATAVACDPAGGIGRVDVSPPVDPCSEPPRFCGLLTVTDLNPCLRSGVRLDWTPATHVGSGTEVTYRVLRDGIEIAADLRVTSYWDLPGDSSPHTYQVFAVNQPCGLASAGSALVTGEDRSAGGVPDSVGNTLKAIHNVRDVVLSWQAAAGAASYSVRRGGDRTLADLASPASEIARPSDVRTTDVGRLLAPESLDFYQIRGLSCTGQAGP